MAKIALIGEADRDSSVHQATNASILHTRLKFGIDVTAVWVSSADIAPTFFDEYAGVWVAPGSHPKDLEKILWAIRYAREHGVPCLGTCGGFQLMVIEYARHVLGISDAQHAEYDPHASNLIISPLGCSSAGTEGWVRFVSGSGVERRYGTTESEEITHCKFGINPEAVPLFKEGPLQFVGFDSLGEIRVIEIPGHPFFVGTLFLPQMKSTAMTPHPLVKGFLQVVINQTHTI